MTWLSQLFNLKKTWYIFILIGILIPLLTYLFTMPNAKDLELKYYFANKGVVYHPRIVDLEVVFKKGKLLSETERLIARFPKVKEKIILSLKKTYTPEEIEDFILKRYQGRGEEPPPEIPKYKGRISFSYKYSLLTGIIIIFIGLSKIITLSKRKKIIRKSAKGKN